MSFILEAIIEIFGELIFQLLVTVISKVVAVVFKKVDTNQMLRRGLKFTFVYVFFGLVIALLVGSMIYSTNFLIVISLSYLVYQAVLSLLQIINKDRPKHPLNITIRIFKTIGHYVYPILLIVFSAIWIQNEDGKSTIIVLSSIAIFVWFMIDMYRLWRYNTKIKQSKIELENKEKYKDMFSHFE
ncbi:hypothetical protein JV173_01320 [Acholeplasma equirhinis]|uniref:hypothetical protein n=1 Tax=Acholeplasma equirhinis TaxID=555393 RepID=UPI00197AB802|nr:hypothetical protein [Acholeplasma equirhinis]MBN3490144.1 hypothetical protein [Acholeplasma equirhinis]